MSKVKIGLLVVSIVGVTTTFALSQPGDRGGFGGRGPGGPPHGRPNPLVEALDADGDHEISAKEIENAVAALKSLDRNSDGKLAANEVSPFGNRGRGGPGGPGNARGGGRGRPGGPGGAGGPGGEGRGPSGGGDASSFVDRIMSFDENNDGKLAKAELPERMQRVLDRLDANKDDVLDKTELDQAAAQFGQGGNSGRGQRGGGRRGPGGPGGPPSADQFVERAMSFDADQDGKLNKDELSKMAAEFARRGPPGGRPDGAGRSGGGRGRRPGGNQRPSRPE